MSKGVEARVGWPLQLTIAARTLRLVGGLCAALVLALTLVVAPPAAVAGTLDQQQTRVMTNVHVVGSDGRSLHPESHAQTFTAGLPGALDQVDLVVERLDDATDPLTVEIRNVAGGSPGASVLASANVPLGSVPPRAGLAFVAVAFATPPTVVAGTQYALVVYTSSSGLYSLGIDRPAAHYERGSHFESLESPPSTWREVGDQDLAFKTYVDQAPTCSAAQATPATLKADAKMQQVTLTGATDPKGTALTYAITAVTQDEPTSGGWKQDTKTPDAAGVSGASVSLRGEQNPTLNGRVYRIAFTATDTAGGNCSGVVKVGVAQKKKGAVSFDDGDQASWDSFTGALVP